MKFLIVDAFTDTLFGGNPAGVVIIPAGQDFPKEEIMIKTAAELRYSETAFIKQLGEREFNIRYFTPAAEVELCGHATIASFSALLHLGMIADNATYVNHTLAETINVKVENGFVMMDMATPMEINTISQEAALKELYEIMGIDYIPQSAKQLNGHQVTLLPKLISTGLPDIMMPVRTKKDLEKLAPNMSALSDLSKKYSVVGVHAFTLDTCGDETVNCRNFAPLYDIDEEAATGTSNGALTYYLYLNGLLKDTDKCKVIQGEAMSRPSVILTSIEATKEKCAIKVGGSAVILAQGEIFI